LADPRPEIDAIFSAAIELDSTTDRAAYLASACAGNEQFRLRVEELIDAYFRAGDFLDPPAVEMPTEAWSSAAETVGEKIGRYKLLEQIGEGGFGVVFMAEQEEPVRRRVALKVIKLGMDTKQVVARFEAERQALAMMDHPNIAKVLDAGATETGRPYFVMELVKGIPITKYCDESKLATADRLRLFIAVCSAVQHAHQKGIIHRDLKPTNVLVTMHDDRPVPKIIDFGIAKAMQGRLTEKTLFTEFRQMVGTPAYMSPEQAQMSGIDIDTRSDIYSLGVLLYQLLTGTTPFASKDLLNAGFAEMQRIIREVDPPPPSTRLTNSKDSLPSISAQRQTEPARLTKLLRGDLDWIVMRCLEKDRIRRYDTASDLAQDIEHYLADEPVEARRPTRLYRLRKFVRRNKAAVLACLSILAALVLGLTLASIGFLRAQQQAQIARTQAARSEQVAVFLQDMLKAAGPGVALGRDSTLLREILDKTTQRLDKDLKNQPEVQGDLWFTLGNTYREIGDYSQAVAVLQHAVDSYRTALGPESGKLALALAHIGRCQSFVGDVPTGTKDTEQAVAIARKFGDPQILANCLFDRARSFESVGSATAEGMEYAREAIGIWGKTNVDPVSMADCMAWLAISMNGADSAEAESLARRSLALHREQLTPDDEKVGNSLFTLGKVLLYEGKYEEAERVLQQTFELYHKIYNVDHPARVDSLRRLATCLAKQGRLTEAESLIRRQQEAVPSDANYCAVFGRFSAGNGQWSSAVEQLAHAVKLDPDNEFYSFSLALALLKTDRYDNYRQVCHAYIDRTAARVDYGGDVDIVLAALLLPVSETDFDRACQFADINVTNPNREYWVPRVYLGEALAELRRKHFASADDWAARIVARESARFSLRAAASFIQASVAAKLQQVEAAQGALAKGDDLVRKGKERDHSADFDDLWEDRSIADMLRREAAQSLAK
jgi:tetratricopeptide (TPR) repeat protein